MWCERFLTQPLYRVFFSAWLIMLAAPITPAIAQQELPDLLASPLVSEEQKAQFRLYERQLERLADIKGHIRRRVQQLSERIDALTVGEVSETLLQQAQVDTRKQQLRREELNHRLNASKVRIKALNQAIENLETRAKLFQNPARQQEETGWQGGQFWLDRQALAQRRFNLALEQKRRELLAIRLAAATQKLEMMELWKRRIENLLRLRYQEGDNVILGDIDGRLDLENVASFGRYVTLTLQLEQQADNLSEAQRRRLETERDIALDRSYLLAQKVLIRNATEALNNIENQIAASGMTSKTLIEHHQTVRQIEKELETLAGELAARAEVYGKERYLLRKRLDAAAGENRKVFRVAVKMSDNLLTELQQLQSELDQQQNRVDTIAQRLNARHAEVRSKELFERRPFIWGTEYWATLSDNLSRTPALLFYQMKISLSAIFNAVTRLGFLDWIVVITLETGLLLALMAFRFGLGRLERRLRTQSATPTVSRIVWMLRQVLQMNLLGIVLLLALIPLSWIVVIVPPSEEIVLMLVSVGVITKLASNLVWLLLNHPDLPRESRYPRVYWALCVTLWSGGLLIMLTALGYLSDLPVILLSALDRLFMLYLLLTALPVFWLLRVVRQRLLNYYGRRYWVNIVRLVSVVIPIFQILIGLAGMSGYLNLAWAGARQLLAFIAVLLGWLLSQQLLNDVAAALKQRAFDDSREVWLATRRVVEPLQRVLGLSLLLTAIYLLISFYSLDDVIAEAWLVLMAAVITVVVLYEILFWLADYAAEKGQGKFIRRLIGKARTPLGLILPVAAAQVTLPLLELPEKLITLSGHMLTLLQIAAVTWFFLRLISLLDQVSESRYKRSEVKEDLVVRRARTQLRVLRQALHLTVVLIGIGAMLMTFPGIRQFGAGLLASAGAAGIVIGIAARPLFENLIAGIQIALTQPIRLDDVVIVEGEWGTIEEINATYVVVQIWDHRRLVVPLNYFNEHPFQHWSRKGTELLGSVFLSVDYSFPVEEGRKALQRILEETELWDGRAWVLQVTDLKGYTMELRALATARDAPTAWDLRCYVREKLIEFIQQHYPASLPQLRTRPAEDEEQSEERGAPPLVIQPHESGLA